MDRKEICKNIVLKDDTIGVDSRLYAYVVVPEHIARPCNFLNI